MWRFYCDFWRLHLHHFLNSPLMRKNKKHCFDKALSIAGVIASRFHVDSNIGKKKRKSLSLGSKHCKTRLCWRALWRLVGFLVFKILTNVCEVFFVCSLLEGPGQNQHWGIFTLPDTRHTCMTKLQSAGGERISRTLAVSYKCCCIQYILPNSSHPPLCGLLRCGLFFFYNFFLWNCRKSNWRFLSEPEMHMFPWFPLRKKLCMQYTSVRGGMCLRRGPPFVSNIWLLLFCAKWKFFFFRYNMSADVLLINIYINIYTTPVRCVIVK